MDLVNMPKEQIVSDVEELRSIESAIKSIERQVYSITTTSLQASTPLWLHGVMKGFGNEDLSVLQVFQMWTMRLSLYRRLMNVKWKEV
jgi:hypothetical protein